MDNFKFIRRRLYKDEHTVMFGKQEYRGGTYQISVEPKHVKLQIGWAGIGCSNCELFFEPKSEMSWNQRLRNYLSEMHPYIALMLFDIRAVEITNSFEQTHDNDEGPSEKRALDGQEVERWMELLQQMIEATPTLAWIVRLVLHRANQVLSSVQL